MLVKDRMSPHPATATPETTHRQANELMRERNIHHLPVVDKNGKLVGIVVEADLLAAQPSAATTLSIYEIHSLLSKLKLKELMISPVHTASPDCPIEEAARVMLKYGVGCLPVVQEDELVGIITDTDIFRTLVALLGGEREGARFTLRLPDRPGVLAQVAQAVTNAGGDIFSVTTWHSQEDEFAHITIKEQGASFADLMQVLKTLDADLVDIREQTNCPEQTHG